MKALTVKTEENNEECKRCRRIVKQTIREKKRMDTDKKPKKIKIITYKRKQVRESLESSTEE